jgi:hypothetical protein
MLVCRRSARFSSQLSNASPGSGASRIGSVRGPLILFDGPQRLLPFSPRFL